MKIEDVGGGLKVNVLERSAVMIAISSLAWYGGRLNFSVIGQLLITRQTHISVTFLVGYQVECYCIQQWMSKGLDWSFMSGGEYCANSKDTDTSCNHILNDVPSINIVCQLAFRGILRHGENLQ